MNNSVLWIISARSGSKSIKDKNIKLLGNLPLIAYKIKTALSVSKNEDVLVSTDSEQYATISKKYGASVPFLRPTYLASDMASSVDVVKHAMNFVINNKKKYKFVALLEPTSPFVYYNYLNQAVKVLSKNINAESIVATCESRPGSFFLQNDSDYLSEVGSRIQEIQNYGRQNFKKQITPSGGFYISKWDSFLKNNGFYSKKTLSFNLPVECELEIDEPIDWLWAEFLLNKNLVDEKLLWK